MSHRRTQAVIRQEQWKRYETWQEKEDSWKRIFAGEPWEPEESEESDYLLGQALLAVKLRFKPLLYFTMTVSGVFLYGFAVTAYPNDLWLYGTVGVSSALASIGLFGWRRAAMKKAEVKVVRFKQALLNGKVDALEKIVSAQLVKDVIWPPGVFFRVQGVSAEVLEVTIVVPGLDMVNQEQASWEETTGVVKFREKPLQERLKHYERLVSAVVLRSGREIFSTCPTLLEAYITVVTSKDRRNGDEAREVCFLSTVLTKVEFQTLNFSHRDYIRILGSFELRYAPEPLEFPNEVQPFRPGDKHATETNSSENISEQPSELLQLDLQALSGEQFQEVVQELVARMGFVPEKAQPSNDGGIDIWAYSDQALNSGHYLIQCKRWSSTVPVEIVRELYGTLLREKADGGILITTSDISSEGQKFISENTPKIPIQLIEGVQLRSLLNEKILTMHDEPRMVK